MVGLAELGCEHLHLAGVESTLVRGKRRPCGNALGSRGQLCIGRYDAKLLLSCENTAAGLIPAHVETAAIACDPLRCRLMRRMDGPGCPIHVEGLFRGGGLEPVDVFEDRKSTRLNSSH